MVELTADGSYNKPPRLKSNAYLQNKPRARHRVEEEGEAERLSPLNHSWSRRREYVALRNAKAAEVIRRTQSLQIRQLADHETDRPSSAGYSNRSRPVSASSSRGKIRRALPQLPLGSLDDIEDRKKRMSMEALDKIKRHSGNFGFADSPVFNKGGFGHHPKSPREPRSPLDAQDPMYHHHHQERRNHFSVSTHQRDKYRLPPSHVYSYEPTPETHQILKPQAVSSRRSTSQELQRIISDLKDASVVNGKENRDSQSSEGSVGRECDYTDPPPLEDQPQEYDFAQLTQWGVIEPSKEEMMSDGIHNPDSSTPHRSNERASSELQVTHPSLHRIIRSCDLINVTLRLPENQQDGQQYGIVVFESTFSDVDSDDKERRPIFRSPSGRKPVIGRKTGAFMPVTPVKSRRDGPILSLAAVDEIVPGSPADKHGQLFEGDYIIEVRHGQF